ncbi:MAG: hypothetical protein BWZ10_00248 [candidate division BRC1 bacterium ADurb.BinA364]|nr:MAG: hypothetical protein BWZ10_00248 [candidate division BRC1 bacterium ADurb.BinA364]
MKMGPFAMEIESLRKGPISFDVDEPVESLDLVDILGFVFDDRVAGRLEYRLVGDDVLIRGRLRAHAVGQCVRCLEAAPCAIDVEVGLAFFKGPAPEEQECDDADIEGAIVDYYDGDQIDPMPQLRDLILLELPDLPKCSGDCKGLCAQCGGNLNEGPCQCSSKADASDANGWKSQLRQLRLDN